jgi:hypothetical protein
LEQLHNHVHTWADGTIHTSIAYMGIINLKAWMKNWFLLLKLIEITRVVQHALVKT